MKKHINLLYKTRKVKFHAFSLLEATFILVVSSLIIAAVLPVVTKKNFQTPPQTNHGTYFCYYVTDDSGNKQLFEDKFSGRIIQKRLIGYPKAVSNCTFTPPKESSYFEITAIGGGGGGGAGVSDGAVKLSDIKTNIRQFMPIGFDGNPGITDADLTKYRLDKDEFSQKAGKVWLFAKGADSSGSDVAKSHLNTTNYDYYDCEDSKVCAYCDDIKLPDADAQKVTISEVNSSDTSKYQVQYYTYKNDCNKITESNCSTVENILNNSCLYTAKMCKDTNNDYNSIVGSGNYTKYNSLYACRVKKGYTNAYLKNKITAPFIAISNMCQVAGDIACDRTTYSANGGDGALCFSEPLAISSGLKLKPKTLPTKFESAGNGDGYVADKNTVIELYQNSTKKLVLKAGRSTKPGSATYANFSYSDGTAGNCFDKNGNQIASQKGSLSLDCTEVSDKSPYGYCYSPNSASSTTDTSQKNALISHYSVNTKANILTGKSGTPAEIKTVIVRSLAIDDINIHIGKGGSVGIQDGADGSSTYLGSKNSIIVNAAGGKGGKGRIVEDRGKILPAYDKNKDYTDTANQTKFSAKDCDLYIYNTNSNNVIKDDVCKGKRDGNIDAIIKSIDINHDTDPLSEILETAGYSGIGGGVNYACFAGQYMSFINNKPMLVNSALFYPAGTSANSTTATVAQKVNEQLAKLHVAGRLTAADINTLKEAGNMIPDKCKNSVQVTQPTNGRDGMLIIRW